MFATRTRTAPPPPPTLNRRGNCTACGEHPVVHIRHGNVIPLREAHRPTVPGGRYADEVA